MEVPGGCSDQGEAQEVEDQEEWEGERPPLGMMRLEPLSDDRERVVTRLPGERKAKAVEKNSDGSALFPAWKVALALRPTLVDDFLARVSSADVLATGRYIQRLMRYSKPFQAEMRVVEGRAESAEAVYSRLWDYAARILVMVVFYRWVQRRVLALKEVDSLDPPIEGAVDWELGVVASADPATVRSCKVKTVLLHGLVSAMARVAEDDALSPFCISGIGSDGLSIESKSILFRAECMDVSGHLGDYFLDPSLLLLPTPLTRKLDRQLRRMDRITLNVDRERFRGNVTALGLRLAFERKRIQHAGRIVEGDSFGAAKRMDPFPVLVVRSMVGQIGDRGSIFSVVDACVRRAHARAAAPRRFSAEYPKMWLGDQVSTDSRLENHTLYHCTMSPLIELCRAAWGADAFVRSAGTKLWGLAVPEAVDVGVARSAAKAWMERPMDGIRTRSAKRARMDVSRRDHMDRWRRAIQWDECNAQLV